MFTGQPHGGGRGLIKCTVISVLYEFKKCGKYFWIKYLISMELDQEKQGLQ